MKINLHKSPLFLYIYINELDSLRKFCLFEDYDETLENFNLEAIKRPLTLEKKNEFYNSDFTYKEVKKTDNFYSDYFINVNL